MRLIICNTCGVLVKEPDEYAICICCKKIFCIDCIGLLNLYRDDSPNYPVFKHILSDETKKAYRKHPFITIDIADRCLQRIESEHIKGIPHKDLPLWVNHVWLDPQSTSLFNELLTQNPSK